MPRLLLEVGVLDQPELCILRGPSVDPLQDAPAAAPRFSQELAHADGVDPAARLVLLAARAPDVIGSIGTVAIATATTATTNTTTNYYYYDSDCYF